MLLFCLAIHSPHCDLCDGIFAASPASAHPLLQHYTPAAQDLCNGICACCGLRGLPRAATAPDSLHTVSANHPSEVLSPAPATHAAVFRPPRIDILA